MEGCERSTQMYTLAAGLSQVRSMLVTCSVRPSLCTKIVFNYFLAIAAWAAANRATGTLNGDALT